MPGVTPRNMNGYDFNGYSSRYNERDQYPARDDDFARVNNGYDRNSMDGRDGRDGRMDGRMDTGPGFEVDHLATYTSRSGPMSIEDGLRKLKQMENSTGIWTMRCEMVVEPRDIVIIDKGNGEEQERFALASVMEPTAVVDDKNHEVYSNLILFTVKEDPRNKYSPADMHIFQSTDKMAPNIVDEILTAKEGRRRAPPSSQMGMPPRPVGPAPTPPFGQRPGIGQSVLGQSVNPRASFMPNMEETGVQNEVLERDVQLLNCCFDDIERFVSRLQAAAESYKELERRKRERNAKKHKTRGGEGLLNMKARPPPADDFVDIFQKFKYAFNLLAKLKAHIHDPNAPELVHFLFTPLSLIFEASRDPIHGGTDLANHARFPLLKPESKQLLLNCLTSKELELWQALGHHWTTNSEEFNGPIEQYNPRFFNGWTPAPQTTSDNNRQMMESAVNNMSHQISQRNMALQASHEVDDLLVPYPRPEGRSFRPVERHEEPEDMYARSTKLPTQPPPGAIPNTSVAQYQEYVEKHIDRNTRINQSARRSPPPAKPRNRQEENVQFAKELHGQNKVVYEIVHERDGRNEKEITVQKGDIVEVVDSSRNWWKVRNYLAQTGYAPYTIMKEYAPGNFGADRSDFNNRQIGDYSSSLQPHHSNIPAPPPMPPDSSRSGGRRDKTDSDDNHGGNRHKRHENHDERLDDDRRGKGGDWKDRSYGSRNESYSSSNEGSIGREGVWGRNEDRYDERRERKRRDDGRERREERHVETRQHDKPQQSAPPPPPSSKPPAMKKTIPPVQTRPRYEGKTHQTNLHDELKKRVSTHVVEAPKGTTYISKYSDADEVKEWLMSKGFSRLSLNTFDGYNGEEMFAVQRKEMNRLLDNQEAHKLDSMLLVQKKISNYGTRGGSELRKILEDRKKKAETNTDQAAHMGIPPSFAPESPDYSDTDSDSSLSDDFANAGKTLRKLLQHQRRRIHDSTYHHNNLG